MAGHRDNGARVVRLGWRGRSVEDVIAAWLGDRPIAAVFSAGEPSRWSRWSILGVSSEIITNLADVESALAMAPGGSARADPNLPPFQSGFIGWISYDAGRLLEPAAQGEATLAPLDDRRWPHACLHRCQAAFVHDRVADRWWAVGATSELPVIEFAKRGETPIPQAPTLPALVSPIPGLLRRGEYERQVARTIEYIHAGDIFQANIGRRLSASFAGSPRSLALRLARMMGPWFGALIEGPTPGRSVLSMSPELFLAVDPVSRRITTRPIKGTAPASASTDFLCHSDKDLAELVMIVDLMRNDLGRVCEFGSVRVVEAQAIERHGGVGDSAGVGVQHGVATVVGTLRRGVSAMDALRATFPPGSITGAPKIRAMQIIDELEPVRRGPYCGSVGWFDDRGALAMNVAIRTASVVGESPRERWDEAEGVVDYSVGAGIVADSIPEQEWEETEAKAAGFVAAMESLRAVAPMAGALP